MTERTPPTPIIAIVEDDDEFRWLLTYWLSPSFGCVGFDSAEAFLDQVEKIKPDLVLIDIGLPRQDGRQVARQLRSRAGPIPIVLLSGMRPDVLREADRGVADAFLAKPFPAERLIACVDRALSARRP